MDDLFSFFTEAKREKAIAASEEHADIQWKKAALDAIKLCAERYSEFTADEVWIALGSEVTTHEPAAMGPVLRKAATNRWITKTDKRRKVSILPQRHRQDITVWASLLGGAEMPSEIRTQKIVEERPEIILATETHEPDLDPKPLLSPESVLGRRLYWQDGFVRPDASYLWRGLHYELGSRVINVMQERSVGQAIRAD